MGLIYEPHSLIERRMEYERKQREEERVGAAWEREGMGKLAVGIDDPIRDTNGTDGQARD